MKLLALSLTVLLLCAQPSLALTLAQAMATGVQTATAVTWTVTQNPVLLAVALAVTLGHLLARSVTPQKVISHA